MLFMSQFEVCWMNSTVSETSKDTVSMFECPIVTIFMMKLGCFQNYEPDLCWGNLAIQERNGKCILL